MKRLLLVLLIPLFLLLGCDSFLDIVPEEDMTTLNLKQGMMLCFGSKVVIHFCKIQLLVFPGMRLSWVRMKWLRVIINGIVVG